MLQFTVALSVCKRGCEGGNGGGGCGDDGGGGGAELGVR